MLIKRKRQVQVYLQSEGNLALAGESVQFVTSPVSPVLPVVPGMLGTPCEIDCSGFRKGNSGWRWPLDHAVLSHHSLPALVNLSVFRLGHSAATSLTNSVVADVTRMSSPPSFLGYPINPTGDVLTRVGGLYISQYGSTSKGDKAMKGVNTSQAGSFLHLLEDVREPLADYGALALIVTCSKQADERAVWN